MKGSWSGPANLVIFGLRIDANLLAFDSLTHDMIIGMDILGPLINKIGAARIFENQIKPVISVGIFTRALCN